MAEIMYPTTWSYSTDNYSTMGKVCIYLNGDCGWGFEQNNNSSCSGYISNEDSSCNWVCNLRRSNTLLINSYLGLLMYDYALENTKDFKLFYPDKGMASGT